MVADIDEQSIRKEKPEDLVLALAHAKADAILALLVPSDSSVNESEGTTILITCDQVVESRGRILEKPSNEAQAREYISSFALHPPRTVASIVCTNVGTGVTCEGLDASRVVFSAIPESVVEELLQEGVTYNVAGGLCVEHP
eukprot:CAMPEP_0196576010 /NCGR_PEP_ID=MMETSP1081-20130531/5381_1 /TAXON_ID=36882 /ORGANISM="Pyramimonas amylifera, Strain CCMP720" /LENGTH=141 /DNA_ID=CAMNT_0041894493 /DNA_START=254 /DNA_END=679 /DNA_ORIENTATION=-